MLADLDHSTGQHPAAVTSVHTDSFPHREYQPQSQQQVHLQYRQCACLQIWTLAQDSTLQLLQVFTQTAFPIESISLNPSNTSFLVALTDGSMSLWQLDTLQELYQYKHDGPIHGVTFFEPDGFYFLSAGQVLCSSHVLSLFVIVYVPHTKLC